MSIPQIFNHFNRPYFIAVRLFANNFLKIGGFNNPKNRTERSTILWFEKKMCNEMPIEIKVRLYVERVNLDGGAKAKALSPLFC